MTSSEIPVDVAFVHGTLRCARRHRHIGEGRDEGEAGPVEDEVDAMLLESDGDHRAAIRALLHDIDVLASNYGQTVSRGYVRRSVVLVTPRRR